MFLLAFPRVVFWASVRCTGPRNAGRPSGRPGWAGSSRDALAWYLVGSFGRRILVRLQGFCGFLLVSWSQRWWIKVTVEGQPRLLAVSLLSRAVKCWLCQHIWSRLALLLGSVQAVTLGWRLSRNLISSPGRCDWSYQLSPVDRSPTGAVLRTALRVGWDPVVSEQTEISSSSSL